MFATNKYLVTWRKKATCCESSVGGAEELVSGAAVRAEHGDHAEASTEHYKPENMKLVVVAPKSLDALEKQVKNSFRGLVSLHHAQDDAIAWLLQEEDKGARAAKSCCCRGGGRYEEEGQEGQEWY